MARPLTGGLRFTRGRWWAGVPDRTAASGRHYESFVADDDARAWLGQAVPAVGASRPLPEAERFRTARPTRQHTPAPPKAAKIRPDIASVAKEWMSAAYEDLRRGAPDRAERVRRIVDGHLIPWFVPRTTTVADVAYFMCHDWLLHLLGRDHGARARPAPAFASPALDSSTDPELSLVGVAALCG